MGAGPARGLIFQLLSHLVPAKSACPFLCPPPLTPVPAFAPVCALGLAPSGRLFLTLSVLPLSFLTFVSLGHFLNRSLLSSAHYGRHSGEQMGICT